MHIEGEFSLRAPSQDVYDFLMDPYRILQCIPGFQKVNVNSPDDFLVVLKPAYRSFEAGATLHFTVAQKDGTEYAKFLVEGIGNDTKVDVELMIRVEDSEIDSSLVRWEADAKLRGGVARVANEKLAREAEKLVGTISDCLRVKLEPKRSDPHGS